MADGREPERAVVRDLRRMVEEADAARQPHVGPHVYSGGRADSKGKAAAREGRERREDLIKNGASGQRARRRNDVAAEQLSHDAPAGARRITLNSFLTDVWALDAAAADAEFDQTAYPFHKGGDGDWKSRAAKRVMRDIDEFGGLLHDHLASDPSTAEALFRLMEYEDIRIGRQSPVMPVVAAAGERLKQDIEAASAGLDRYVETREQLAPGAGKDSTEIPRTTIDLLYELMVAVSKAADTPRSEAMGLASATAIPVWNLAYLARQIPNDELVDAFFVNPRLHRMARLTFDRFPPTVSGLGPALAEFDVLARQANLEEGAVVDLHL